MENLILATLVTGSSLWLFYKWLPRIFWQMVLLLAMLLNQLGFKSIATKLTTIAKNPPASKGCGSGCNSCQSKCSSDTSSQINSTLNSKTDLQNNTITPVQWR